MKIIIQDQIVEVENDEKEIEDCLNKIEKILKERKINLIHLIIDNKPIYKNFTDYILAHIHEIDTILVVTDTEMLFVLEILVSTNDYLKKVMPQLESLADEFYEQPDHETWIKLGDLFEGIQWLIATVVKIDRAQKVNPTVNDYEIWNEYVQRLVELGIIVKEMEGALNNKDNILIGDLLRYEVTPLFKKIHEKLIFLVNRGDNCVS